MTLGGGLEWCFGSRRVGLRLDAAYAQRPCQLEFGESSGFTQSQRDAAVVELGQFGDVDTWFADASLMLRLLPALDDAIENQKDLPADRLEFVRFGSTGTLPMGAVLYVGSMDGTPLYAARADVGGFLPELERRLTGNRDLDDVLDDEEFTGRFVNEIETFYLAVEPGSASCVFQPVSSTRVVRRTKG